MRLSVVMTVVAAGALLAPAVACADQAPRTFLDVAIGWAIPAAQAQEVQDPRQGFFVGVQSGLIDSGVAPAVAGISMPLNTRNAGAVMANGYYAYVTDWDIGTYVGGGFGQLNLGIDEFSKAGASRDYAYQGMAGLTYSFTPAMALGLEYRYAATIDPLLGAQPLPNEADAQSLTLRFDFVLN
jgi:hypothetical protein